MDHVENKGVPEKYLLCFIEYARAFDCMDQNKLWKVLPEMGVPDHLTSLLRNLYAGQEATKPDMEQLTGSKLGKEYIKALRCLPAYLTLCTECVSAKSLQPCPTLCDPMDCSQVGSSVHGILQARILDWVAIPPPGDLLDPGIESIFNVFNIVL